MELTLSDFDHEVVSNGRARGHERADIFFPSSEAVITSVAVKNGQRVAKGQRLATLDTYKLRTELSQAETALAKAELDLKDALIGQGYDPEKQDDIPDETVRLARLRSGYTDALAKRDDIRHQITLATITAPFYGHIANLKAKPFNRPDASEPFCTVIGNRMDVEFKILEGELSAVSAGDRVEITPFSSDGTYHGRISEINPAVDEDGLVTAVAAVEGSGLYDGMNVRVCIRKSLGNRLVVPKSAVVLRSGKQVVFTLDKDGKRATWNYVRTALENMNEYSIAEGLEPGMKVITSGNVNLAHESPVTVVK